MAITNEKTCPKCGGSKMYDNRETKTNPKAPDFKCATSGCDGAIWPVRDQKGPSKANTVATQGRDMGPHVPGLDDAAPYSQITSEHTAQPSVKSTQMYLDAMKFVVDKVVPIWEAGKVPYTASDINAATATVMIDHQRRSGR